MDTSDSIKHGADNDNVKKMKTKYASLANAKDAKQHVRWWTKEAVERYHELVNIVLEKRADSSILNLELEFQLRYNMSFNLRGRSSRKKWVEREMHRFKFLQRRKVIFRRLMFRRQLYEHYDSDFEFSKL